jgi:hypothetical protein
MTNGGFDVARLVQRFGNRSRLHARLVSRGHKVSIKMVEKWRERSRIPDKWLAEMMAMAQEEGKPLDLNEYMTAQVNTGADDVLG